VDALDRSRRVLGEKNPTTSDLTSLLASAMSLTKIDPSVLRESDPVSV
jgi:hypothetical protein